MRPAGTASPSGRWIRNNLEFLRGFLSHAPARHAIAGAPRIILVPGWSLTPGSLAILQSRLAADGFDADVFRPGGIAGILNTRAVELSAQKLIDHIRLGVPDGEGVSIVGHSLGGIIGRYLVCAPGGGRPVHTLVTLASPHRGSPAARAAALTPLRWLSKGVLELRPESRFMKALRAARIPDDVYVASLYSETDDLCPVPCAEIEIPEGATNIVNIDVGAYGHFEFATDEGIYFRIREELRRGIAKFSARAQS